MTELLDVRAAILAADPAFYAGADEVAADVAAAQLSGALR